MLRQAREIVSQARSVTVLTGAGVSAESGIPTFRGPDGYWQGLSIMDLASPQGFDRDPHKVWEWYNLRRQALRQAQPNAGHHALVRLEQAVPQFGLVTQNVDRLHQAAGSRKLVELHGNIWEVRCTGCEAVFDRTGVELPATPHCEQCGAWLRPAVVWFGELLPPGVLETAMAWACRAELFLVVGTSAVVMPAASLAYMARNAGAKVIEINPEATSTTKTANLSLRGKAGEILPHLV
jgi:NAD-dependent deacetylase